MIRSLYDLEKQDRKERRRGYTWDKYRGQYVSNWTGKHVQDATVRRAVRGGHEYLRKDNNILTNKLLKGDVNIAQWQKGIARNLKESWGASMRTGAGPPMSTSVRGKLGNRMRREYAYLDNFAKEIANGKLTEGQIRIRIDMYADAATVPYWLGTADAKKQAGYREGKRVLGAADHCFPAGTLIHTPGGQVNIEDIKLGDIVTTLAGPKRVTKLFKQKYTSTMIEVKAGHEEVNCTANHPFLTDRGWIQAQDLLASDHVFIYEDRSDQIESKIAFPYSVDNISALSKVSISRFVAGLLFFLPFSEWFKTGVSVPPIPISFNDYTAVYHNVNNKFRLNKLVGFVANTKFINIIKQLKFKLARFISLKFPVSSKKFFRKFWALNPKFFHLLAQSFGSARGMGWIVVSHIFSSLRMNYSMGSFFRKRNPRLVSTIYDLLSSSVLEKRNNSINPIARIDTFNNSVFFGSPSFVSGRIAINTELTNPVSFISTFRTYLKDLFSFWAACKAKRNMSISLMPAGGADFFVGSSVAIGIDRPAFPTTDFCLCGAKVPATNSTDFILHRYNPQLQLYSNSPYVYNLEVEDVHHYIANRFVVHNCNDCLALAGIWMKIDDLPVPGEATRCLRRCQCRIEFRGKINLNEARP